MKSPDKGYQNGSKGIADDSNYIFLWLEPEDKNNQKKKNRFSFFQNFSWFQFYNSKLCMIMGIGIAS